MLMFDDDGAWIKGLTNRLAAERSLAKIKVTLADEGPQGVINGEWIVARVCSEYLQYCDRAVAKGALSIGHRNSAKSWLNDLCAYCGALPLALKGLKKPSPKPRLQSISPEDEKIIYANLEPQFKNFLFAAIHIGLRPFCELAKLVAEHVEHTPRGMMWRVYSSKTKKTRKIPVWPEVASLVMQLLKDAPLGSNLPLFRNTKGRAWKRMTGVVRFGALRRKLGWDQDPIRSQSNTGAMQRSFASRVIRASDDTAITRRPLPM